MSLSQVRQLTAKEKLALAKNTFGLMSRVARKCQVNHSLVARVLRGTNTSARVSAAIEVELAKEIRRAEKLAGRFQHAAPAAERPADRPAEPETAVA